MAFIIYVSHLINILGVCMLVSLFPQQEKRKVVIMVMVIDWPVLLTR